MRLSLIYGGRSVEHDWSIAMYDYLAGLLNRARGGDLTPSAVYYIGQEGRLLRLSLDTGPVPDHRALLERAETHPLTDLAYRLKADGHFVFSLLQGQDGEDGQIQALAQFHEIPGSFGDKTSAMLTTDKYLQGIVASRLCPELTEIPTVHVRHAEPEAAMARALRDLSGPCVLKPNTLGGSFLTECVEALNEGLLRHYAERISPYDPSFLVQRRIIGTEYTCGVLIVDGVAHTLPVAKIVNPTGFLGYDQKTTSGSYRVEFESVDAALRSRISAIALTLAREFDLHTIGRFDFIVDDVGRIHFLEVNIVPGLTARSIFPKMLKEAGYDLLDVVRLSAANEARHQSREARRKLATSLIRYGGASAAEAA